MNSMRITDRVKPGFVFALLLSVCLPFVSHAQLTWSARDTEQSASAAQTQAVAEFPFTNTGDKPVTIRSVTPSCGCTTAELEKTVYAPGESGTITATFDFGARTGLEVKTIRVMTDDPKNPEVVLTMRVRIPKLLEIQPQFVYWKHDEPKEPKTIEVKVVGDEPIQITKLDLQDPALQTTLTTLIPGKHYKITVTPTGRSSNQAHPAAAAVPSIGAFGQPHDHNAGLIAIQTDYPQEKPRTFQAYARILPEQAPQPGLSPLNPLGAGVFPQSPFQGPGPFPGTYPRGAFAGPQGPGGLGATPLFTLPLTPLYPPKMP